MTKGMFISYWRTNFTRTIRICRVCKFATPEVLHSFRIAGRKLSDKDVVKAESILKEMVIA